MNPPRPSRWLLPIVTLLVVLTTALGGVVAPAVATVADPAAPAVTLAAKAHHTPRHLTQAQATARALKALKVEKSTDPVHVFALKGTRKPGIRITEAGRSVGARSAQSTFRAPLVMKLKKRSYVFYADDAPYTLYQHRGRVVVVPEDGSALTVRKTTFAPVVDGAVPRFLRSQARYQSKSTVFARDWSAGTGAINTHRRSDRAIPADSELAVAQALAEQDTCIVRTVGTDIPYAGVNRTTSAVGAFFGSLAGRAPDLVSVNWSPRKSPVRPFVDALVADRGCRSLLIVAAGGGYATGAPAVSVGTSVSGRRHAQVTVHDLTAADLSALVASHPDLGISLVLDAPYTGRFAGPLTTNTNIDALLTPGGDTKPAFGYLPGVRSGRAHVSNTANPDHLLENTNRILTGLRQFTASGAEIDHYESALRTGNARSLVAWMLVRAWTLGSSAALVDRIAAAPEPIVYSPVDVTGPQPNQAPTADNKSLSLNEDGSGIVTFSGTDPEGESLTFEVVSQPQHGVLSASAGGVRYDPAADFNGGDSFTYRAIDADGATSAPATVTIVVAPANDGPAGGHFDANAHEDDPSTPVAAPGLLAGASDIDGDSLTATPDTGTGTAGGHFDVRADGSFDYDPSGAFEDLGEGEERVDTFDVVVGDPSGSQATVTIRVHVTGDNDAPVVDLGTTTAVYTEDDPEQTLAPSLTIADVDSADVSSATVVIAGGEDTDVLTWTIPVGSGITASYDDTTRTLTASGSASKADYRDLLRSVAFHSSSDTPDTSARTVTFSVTDPAGDDGDDDLTLSVAAHDDLSAAVADSTTVAEDSGTTPIDVLANDVDPDGNGPTVDSVTQPAADEGSVTITGGGTGVSYATASDFNGSTSFTYTLAGGSTATVTVAVTAVNDAPTLDGPIGQATFTEDDTTGVIVNDAITVADVDNASLTGATVSIGAGFDAADDRLTFTDTANITSTYDASTGVLTLSGADTKAAYQTALRSVRYKNVDTSDPGTATRVVTFEVSDGSSANATSNTITGNVTVTPVNDQPTITAGSTAASFTEGGAPVVIDNTVTVADVDNASLAGATVKISGNYVSTEDVLAFTDTANIAGSYDDSTGTLTLAGSDTLANYRAALRAVTYADTNTETASAAARTITFRVSDGALTSAAASSTVTVVAVNDAPTLADGGNTVTFDEDDTNGVVVNNAITVADVDNADLAGATASITDNFLASEDELRFADTAEITGSYNATTGVLTLTGTATKAQYQAALRTVRYRNNNTADPSPLARKVSFRVDDGQSSSNLSNTVVTTANVNPHNDAPVVTAGSSAASFTEGGSPVVVDDTVTVTDVDNASLTGATVQITGNYVSAEDVLAFTDTAAITGSYDDNTGTLTLTGSDTVADYRAALRSVTYTNTNAGAPSPATRTVTFKVSDGSLTSAGATSTVAVVAVNSAPILSQSSSAAAYTEDGTPAAVAPDLEASDPDSTNLGGAVVTLTTNREGTDRLGYTSVSGITGTYDDVTGVLALDGDATVAQYQAALRSITFRTVSDTPSPASRTLTVVATDASGADSNTLTRTITVATANDAPVLAAGAQADTTFTEGDASAVVVDSGITVSDPDSADLQGGSVSITADFVSAEDELVYPATLHGVTGSYNATTGVLTLTGTATKADYQDVLRSVRYRDNSSAPDGGARTVEFQVSDAGGVDSNVTSKGVVVVSLNDAPVLGGGGNTVAYTEDDAATVVNGAITVSDTDDTDIEGATVAITGGFDATEDALVFVNTGSITGSYNSATGVLTLSGTDTKAGYQAALRTVTYVNSDNVAPSSASRTVRFVVNDGEADSDPVTTTVTVAQHPDAPTVTSSNTTMNTFTEGDSIGAIVDNTLVVADVDSTSMSGATVSITTGFSSAQGDSLAFTPVGSITGSYNGSTGILTISGPGTTAQYETALRSVSYANASQAPTTSRTVAFVVQDESSTSSAAYTQGVTNLPVNDPPVLGGGGALAYTENDAPTAISPALVLQDPDNANISSATVAITGGFSAGQDVLSLVNTANITGSYNAATGVLTLSGTDTVAAYQAALRAVRYVNSSDDPATVQRTMTYTATDTASSPLSGTTTATVDVTRVNDAPVADDESFSGADSAIGNTTFVGNDATDGAPDPTGPQKTVSANILAGDTDAEGDTVSVLPGTFASNDGGSVTVQADGDFIFTPAAGTSCSDQSDFFDYTISDGASPTPGTDTGRVTIAITDCVVYVDNEATAGGNGTSATPYNNLAAADAAASHTGDYIYVYQGDGTTAGLTGGVSLLASQRLVGAAEDLTVAGTTLETGVNANRPAISGSVTLAAGNTVEGLAITASAANVINGGSGDASGTLDDLVLTPSGAAGSGITLNGTSGTWNVSDTTITATSGAQGIFVSSAGTVNFASSGTISITAAGPAFSALSTAVSGAIDTTTSTGGSYGWALNAVTGSLDLGGGSVSGHTSTEVSVTAGSGDVTYSGTLGNGTGTTAVIQNRTAGAVTLSGNINDSNDSGGGISMSGNSGGSTTFSGSTKTLSTGSSNAVDLAFTGGHTVSFTGGGLDIDTTSGSGISSNSANGFLAVTGNGNTIDVTSGTSGTKGLNVNGPDITANGLMFQRISTTAADDGIVLANTGSAGSLTVTGTGTSGTGGVITTSTGPGISLSNTRDVSLSGVNVTNGGDDGIRATSVTNLSIAGNAGTGLASAITGNGNAGGEDGLDLTEVAGTATITNATVTGNYDNNLAITNDAATLANFTVDDGAYGATNSTGGNDSIQIVNTGSGNLTGTIKNADFMNSRGDHIQLVTDNDPTTTSTQKLTIEGNTLNSTALSSTVLGGGIALGVGGGATQTVLVDNNDIDHAHGAAISFNTTTGTSPNANWTVNNNRIGNTGEVKSGSVANSGFYINVNGNGNAKFDLTNNTIMQTDFTAVDAVQNDGDAAMNITMKGNQIVEPGTTLDYAYGLRFVIGSDVPDNGTSCLDLGDPSTTALKNRFFGSGNASQGYQDVRVRMAGAATVNLAGYTGAAHDNAAVNAWIQNRNNIGGLPTVSSSQFDAGSFYGQVSSCPLPSVP